MIGVYDYTVILTYLSMMSGAVGIIATMTGIGHPYIGIIFLMIPGFLDGFDGRVARTKKNRTEFEKNFGVQIDSLSDLICFGVLPAAIGIAQLRKNGIFTELVRRKEYEGHYSIMILLIAITVIYILAALIRLAYFNVTIDERKKQAAETGVEYFTGLPVTSAALIFPLALILNFYIKADLTIWYFLIMLLVAVMFLLNVKVRKVGNKGMIVIVLLGLVEFISTIMIVC